MLSDTELTKLYEQYGFLVHRRCVGLLRNAADAEDALQETFLRAKRFGSRPTGSGLSWLYAIASNVCFDLMAKRRREQPASEDDVAAAEPPAQGSPDDGDRRALLGAVLRTFDDKTRTIGVLHFLDGYTQEEVATQTGFSRKTVGKKLKLFEDAFRRSWTARGPKELS